MILHIKETNTLQVVVLFEEFPIQVSHLKGMKTNYVELYFFINHSKGIRVIIM